MNIKNCTAENTVKAGPACFYIKPKPKGRYFHKRGSPKTLMWPVRLSLYPISKSFLREAHCGTTDKRASPCQTRDPLLLHLYSLFFPGPPYFVLPLFSRSSHFFLFFLFLLFSPICHLVSLHIFIIIFFRLLIAMPMTSHTHLSSCLLPSCLSCPVALTCCQLLREVEKV